MAKTKLRAALDNHKGRDFEKEKQKKLQKEARKRKEQKKAAVEDDEEEGGVTLEEVDVKPVNGKERKGKPNPAVAPAEEEDGWETEETDEEEGDSDDDDDMEEMAARNLAHLDDSESDVSGDEEEDEDEDEEEDEDDIPLSDIESLASEDKGDIIPHQRLTINNTSALLAALHRIQLNTSKMAFSEHMSITSAEPVDIPDVEDDLQRELAFYKQSLAAVKDARERLKKEGVPFSRPADYFAEMVKSDEHMGKIKSKLMDEAANKKAAAEARKQRDLKKFGKQVQVAKMQERAKEKRETLEKINILKRKRQGENITKTDEADMFDIELDDAAKSAKGDRKRGADGKGSNNKRQKKDHKYGFGGKKRHAKSGDAMSSADMSGFSLKKMREGKSAGKKPAGKAGAHKRPGKARRAKKF